MSRPVPLDVDLAHAAVFFDFDGTITDVDTIHHLMGRLAPDDGWREASTMFRRGEISARQCLSSIFDDLPRDVDLIRRVAAEPSIDPAFEPLVARLTAAGAEVSVVSDGFGFYVHERLGHLGVPILTNAPDWDAWELTWPNLDACCACSTCGTCKQAPIREAKARGRTTVFVGDGPSDRKAVLLADVVFATGHLADWCEQFDVPFRFFRDLGDVSAALGGRPEQG